MTDEPQRRGPLERTPGALDQRRASMTQIDLRVDPAATRRGTRSLSFIVPLTPNTWTSWNGVETLWLGPDEWLLLGGSDPRRTAELIDEIHAAFQHTHHSVIDVSAARTIFELRGAERLDLLAAGCGLDLHPRSWHAGICAQTMLARVPVLLQEHDGMTRLLVRPSFAGHLVAWLSAVSSVSDVSG